MMCTFEQKEKKKKVVYEALKWNIRVGLPRFLEKDKHY